MPDIRLQRVVLMPNSANLPTSVSNFKKAVVTCSVRNAQAAYAGGKCVITLFEAVRNGVTIDTVKIGTKSVNIVQGIDELLGASFSKSTTFPGPSVFPHFYFAVIHIKAAAGRKNEFATTSVVKLDAAALVPVNP